MNLNLLNDPEFNNILNQIERLKQLNLDITDLLKQVEEKYGIKLAQPQPHSPQPQGVREVISPLEVYQNTTDEEFIEMFRQYDLGKGKRKPETARQHNDHLNYFLNWYRENGIQSSILNISYEEAGDFLYYLEQTTSKKGEKFSNHSINNYHKSLSAFYTYLNRELGILNTHIPDKKERNHFNNINYISKKNLPVREEVLDSEEMKELLRTIKETTSRRTPYIVARNHLLFRIMMTTGLRASEICKLKIQEVNFEEGSIFVNKGKGADGGKDRITLFSQTIEEEYLAYLELRQQIDTDLDNVFVTEPVMRKGKMTIAKPLVGDDLNEYIAKYMAYSNNRSEGRKVTNHTLRHSFVTMMMLELAVPDVEVAQYCGHNAVETTRKIYTHNKMDKKKKQKNKERMERVGL